MAACGLAGFFRNVASERVLKTGVAIVLGVALVVGAGLQWVELSRISARNEVVLSRIGDVRTVVTTRPDSAFGDIEGTMITVRTRSDGRSDTLSVISAHGESARTWLDQATLTVLTEQVRWIGSTIALLAALAGLALLARYLAIGAVGLGVLVGSAAQFALHVASGVVFFSAYAPFGESIWVYSAAYNAAYLIPQTALALVLLPPLLRRVDRGSVKAGPAG
jgi:hypothetical protein